MLGLFLSLGFCFRFRFRFWVSVSVSILPPGGSSDLIGTRKTRALRTPAGTELNFDGKEVKDFMQRQPARSDRGSDADSDGNGNRDCDSDSDCDCGSFCGQQERQPQSAQKKAPRRGEGGERRREQRERGGAEATRKR